MPRRLRRRGGGLAARPRHEHHVDAHRSVQIGIRGHAYAEDDGHTSRELGYRIVDKEEFDELGVEAVRQGVQDYLTHLELKTEKE